MFRWVAGLIGVLAGMLAALGVASTGTRAAEPIQIGIGYLGHAGARSTLSLVEQPAENDGVAGARLAIDDNNTTGKFLNQRFTLDERRLRGGEDVVQAATALAEHNGFIIADLPADAQLLLTGRYARQDRLISLYDTKAAAATPAISQGLTRLISAMKDDAFVKSGCTDLMYSPHFITHQNLGQFTGSPISITGFAEERTGR